MSGKSRTQIIHDFEDHIEENGGVFGEWFVGVTDRPKHRLFTEHKLKPSGDAWISRRAVSGTAAIEIEEYFRTVRKTRARQSDVAISAVYVYAYKMKAHTSP